MPVANLSPDSPSTQQDERDNVVVLRTKLELYIRALWRKEAQIRERAANARTLEEMQTLYAMQQRIIPWLLKYPEFNPDPEPRSFTPEEIARIVAEVEAATGKKIVRATTAGDVTRREDARDRQDPGPKSEQDYGRGAKTSKPKKVKIVMGTSIETRPIDWLWPDWLAHGKLHIFAGRPGCLKTTTAIGFAAGITVGGKWPDGTRMAQGNVIVWSGEDAIDDTLLPRFLAAGGHPAHIAFIKGVEEDGKTRAFNPAADMAALAEVCAELGNVNLIIIDPVVMIATGDSHKNAETRKDLQPLVDLAEKTQAVVIGIHHLTKRSEGANPVDRVSGSLAFGAAPRVILLNALDPKGGAEPRGVLMRAKSNIGPSHGGYSFSADQRQLDGRPGISAQRVLWGEFVDKSAGDIFEEYEGKAKAAVEKKRKIVEFLTEALASGPRMAAEVEDEGEKLGFSPWALRRALKKMGGHPTKPSFKSGWVWDLPGQAA